METRRDQLTDGDKQADFNKENNSQPPDGNYNIENVINSRQHEVNNTQNISIDEERGGKSTVPMVDTANSRSRSNNPNRSKPWIESLMTFACEVSVVGLRYVAKASVSAYRRAIWAVLILAGAAYTTFQIENRISTYLSYPVNVIIHVDHMEEMRFPTVTICNENRLSLAKASTLGKWCFVLYLLTSSANGTIFCFYCLCRCYLVFLVR